MAFFEELRQTMKVAKEFFPDDGKNSGDEKNTLILKCSYCGAENKIIWTGGALPRCPACGGMYDADQIEEYRKTVVSRQAAEMAKEPPVPWHKKYRKFLVLGGIMLVLMIVAAIIAALNGGKLSMHMNANFEVNTGSAPVSSDEDRTENGAGEAEAYEDLFVEDQGITCVWDQDNGWWYSEESDCYVRYHADEVPAKWTYWKPEISGNFGDFGWLYCDGPDDIWYVEIEEDKWEPLPDEYDISVLWTVGEDTEPEGAE